MEVSDPRMDILGYQFGLWLSVAVLPAFLQIRWCTMPGAILQNQGLGYPAPEM